MTRLLDIRISAAAEHGFIVWEGGEIIAGLSTRSEVAMWIERRLGGVDVDAPREPTTEALPAGILPGPGAQQRRGIWSRST